MKIRLIALKVQHCEHIGLVGFATCETLKLHWLVGIVNVWLCLTGLLIVFSEDLPAFRPSHDRKER